MRIERRYLNAAVCAFILLTAEHPGGAFHGSLQVARAIRQ